MFEDGCLFFNACKALRFASILFYFSAVYTGISLFTFFERNTA